MKIDEVLKEIKKKCQSQMKNNDILASVLSALAIDYISNRKDAIIINTNNLYGLVADKNWSGKCYDSVNKELYDSLFDYKGNYELLRVYDSYESSVEDFVQFLLTTRSSENGPFTYSKVKNESSYNKVFSGLQRAGFTKNVWHRSYNRNWDTNMCNIITKYELQKWDEEVNNGEFTESEKFYVKRTEIDKCIFTTSDLDNAKSVADTNSGYRVYDDLNNLIYDPYKLVEDKVYRVRKSVDDSESQLLITTSYEEAERTASAHKGYKVFDDNDNLLFDSNAIDISVQAIDNSPTKSVLVIQPGERVYGFNIPVYKDQFTSVPLFFVKSDPVYYFDSRIINNRVRVTKTNDKSIINGKNPLKICGWVEV